MLRSVREKGNEDGNVNDFEQHMMVFKASLLERGFKITLYQPSQLGKVLDISRVGGPLLGCRNLSKSYKS
jgi:hypothetical protein